MTLKVKIRSSLTLKTLIPSIKKGFKQQQVKRTVKDEIVAHIEAGKSPVAGKKFKQYSDSYSKIKGRKRPVDMTVTGDMLRSIIVKNTRNSFSITFRSKIADFHNRLGAGKSKVIRRLLPTNNGERFAIGIRNKILRAVKRVASKAIVKQNK